jgi:hypothetical protein
MAMDETEFFSHIRMTKTAFNSLLDILKNSPLNTFDCYDSGKTEIPMEQALPMTLWYLASKTTFREIGNLFGYNKGRVHSSFYKVLSIINGTEELQIQWNFNYEELEKKFRSQAGFPGVVGALDGTHIRIRAPQVQRDYNSRKMVHTMVLMAVCDNNLNFTMISTGFPGSMHDNRAFEMTSVGKELGNIPNSYFDSTKYHLLGDSAFAIRLNLMVPFRDTGNLLPIQINYNHKLSQTRQVIERAFGMLTTRFRALSDLEVDIENAAPIIKSCCIIHNFSLKFAARDITDCNFGEVDLGGDTPVSKRDAISHYL